MPIVLRARFVRRPKPFEGGGWRRTIARRAFPPRCRVIFITDDGGAVLKRGAVIVIP
jgi:hypothetical protein